MPTAHTVGETRNLYYECVVHTPSQNNLVGIYRKSSVRIIKHNFAKGVDSRGASTFVQQSLSIFLSQMSKLRDKQSKLPRIKEVRVITNDLPHDDIGTRIQAAVETSGSLHPT